MNTTRWLKNEWDRAAAVVAALVGLAAMGAGWVGVSGVSLQSEQIPYLVSGALVGLFALGIAATLWLSAELHDQWRKLDDIHRTLSAHDDD